MREVEVCQQFAEYAREDGWTVYPECGAWDLVLVWERDDEALGDIGPRSVRYGDQVAVEAKTRANFKAICQCADRGPTPCSSTTYARATPNWIAVLAPSIPNGFGTVAGLIGYETIDLEAVEGRAADEWRRGPSWRPNSKHRMDPEKRLWTPPIVPDVAGGQPSPSALTPWRIAALRMCVVLRHRGWVSKHDFDDAGFGRGLWRDRRWIVRDGDVELEDDEGTPRHYARYRMPEDTPRSFPDKGWEGERDAVVKAAPDWIPDEIREAWLADHEPPPEMLGCDPRPRV